jgi:hypothetical protein
VSRRGFYDKEQLTVGDNLYDTIMPAAGKTFAFIQLVQLETFDTSRAENWSFSEYQAFQEHSEKELMGRDQYRQVFGTRFAPILAGDEGDLKLDLLPWDYELWSNRIFTPTLFLKLPMETTAFDGAMKQLKEKIVSQVFKIIENFP